MNGENHSESQNIDLISFLQSPLGVAIITALLAGLGYIGHLIIQQDRTDLIVRNEGVEQIVSISNQSPNYNYNRESVYFKSVRYQLVISHSKKGTKPVRITRLAFGSKLIDLDDKTEAMNGENHSESQNIDLISFLQSPLGVAIITALLAGLGYIGHLIIQKDRTDLIVRSEGVEQIVPTSSQSPEYNGKSIYFEAVRYQLVVSHNKKGKKPIRITRLAFETKPIDLDDKTKAHLDYQLDVTNLPGFGIVQLKEYAFELDGNRVSGRYLKSREESVEVDPNNVFRSTEGTTAITIEPDGDFAFLQPIFVVETSLPGMYQFRNRLYYDVAGISKELETPWIYIFMQ